MSQENVENMGNTDESYYDVDANLVIDSLSKELEKKQKELAFANALTKTLVAKLKERDEEIEGYKAEQVGREE